MEESSTQNSKRCDTKTKCSPKRETRLNPKLPCFAEETTRHRADTVQAEAVDTTNEMTFDSSNLPPGVKA